MQIVVSTVDGNIYPIDVNEGLPLNDLKALLSLETNIPQSSLLIYHNMRELRESQDGDDTLSSLGICDKDILVVARRQDVQAPPTHQAQTPVSSDAGTRLPDIDWSSIRVPQSSKHISTCTCTRT